MSTAALIRWKRSWRAWWRKAKPPPRVARSLRSAAEAQHHAALFAVALALRQARKLLLPALQDRAFVLAFGVVQEYGAERGQPREQRRAGRVARQAAGVLGRAVDGDHVDLADRRQHVV